MKIYRLFSLLLFLIIFSRPLAQHVQYLGIEQGLSNNATTSIYKDHKGFMWFGTYDGLNKYDGTAFKVFQKKAGDSSMIMNNSIGSICGDQKDNIWVDTDGGAFIYHPITNIFSLASFIPQDSAKEKKIVFHVKYLKSDKNGSVFMLTKDNGLLVFDNGSEVGRQITLLDGNKKVAPYNAKAMTINYKNNEVWLYVENIGLCRYDRSTNTIRTVNNKISQVNSMLCDNEGDIWLANDTGLLRYTIATNAILGHYFSDIYKITCFLLDDTSPTLWIGTNGKGILLMDLKSGKIRPLLSHDGKDLLNSKSVLDMFEDETGRKWISTIRGGINVILATQNPFTCALENSQLGKVLAQTPVSAFCENDDGNIWIGTNGYGLRYWDRKRDVCTFYENISGKNQLTESKLVTTIVQDANKDVWVSTWSGGINRYNKSTNTFSHYTCFNPITNKEETQVWFVYEDRDKRLWASTSLDGTLYYFDSASNHFKLFDKSIVNALCMAEDKAGSLWVGNYSSLIKIDKQQKKTINYQIGSTVRCIHEGKNGDFWIGTQGGGLLLFNRKNGTFKRFDDTNGLMDNTILRIEEDAHGNLWMSSFTGLIKFDINKKQFIRFTQSDGLQSNQFSFNGSTTLRSGEMIFGNIKGANLFHPDSIKTPTKNANVFVTGILIDGKDISADTSFITRTEGGRVAELTVPFDKAYIALDFVSPEYIAPDKIKYSYFMKGWDKEFSKNHAAKSAVYSQLHEGTYCFMVRASNVWGVWGEPEQVLKITVLPPWYRTWWAFFIYAFAAGSVIYFYVGYKKNQEKLRYKIKFAELQVKKEEELNEKKLSFFTNIAHEFSTPITLIVNPLQGLRNMLGSNKLNGDIDVVYRNAKRLMSLVDQLMLFRKAESETADLNIELLDFVLLCKEVFLCFSQQAASKSIMYDFVCSENELPVYADQQKMEVCLFNLISNAFKYNATNGKIVVHVGQSNNHATVSVTDFGQGIPEEVGQHLFEKFYQVHGHGKKSKKGFGIGLYLVKTFVRLHKGSINYTSSADKGTIFTIHLLKGRSHFPDNVFYKGAVENVSFLEDLIEEPESNLAYEPEKPIEESIEMVTERMLMLIIDDNRQLLEYMARVFKNQFIIYEADNGDDGFKTIIDVQPDVIISDISMPGKSGMELCKMVKSDNNLKHIPFILLTGDKEETTRLKGIEAGADDFIAKPFDKDLLVARVKGILMNRNNLQQYFFNEITLRPNLLKISLADKDFIGSCISIVEKNLDNDTFNVQVFANQIGMSRSNLFKRIKAVSGQSVNSFIRLVRLRKAAELLINTQCNVNEVAFQIGIKDIKYFREQFVKLFHLNPSDYVKKHRKTLGDLPFRFAEEQKK